MTLQWIWKQNKKQFGKVAALSLIGVLNSVLGVAFALYLKEVVDCAVRGDMTGFKWMGIFSGAVILATIAVRFLLRYLEEYARTCAEIALRKNIFDVMLTRNYGVITGYHTGELMNHLTSDINIVTDSFISLIPCLLSMIVRLIGIVVVMVMLDRRFALVFILGGTGIILGSLLLRRRMKWYHTKMQESNGAIRSFLQEALESIIVIRAFCAEKVVEEQSDERFEAYKRLRMKKLRFSNLSQTGFGILMNLGYLFGILWCGHGILLGTLSYGTLIAVSQLISQIQLPISNISAIIPQYYTMIASAERLIAICNIGQDRSDRPDSLDISFESINGDGITMSYDKAKEPVLENASFCIRKGEFVAIRGISGIGKSTLLKLFLGLYPIESGKLCIVDENGFRRLTSADRWLFSYVPQGNMLMAGTIKQVITMYKTKSCDEKRLEESCKIACAAEFISSLPRGYETVLGEKGHGLSEGQMQRIAIARAIYHDAPVLLLDEATSALDDETELQVLQNLKRLTQKTVIIITHRKAALQYCDRQITICDKQITDITGENDSGR